MLFLYLTVVVSIVFAGDDVVDDTVTGDSVVVDVVVVVVVVLVVVDAFFRYDFIVFGDVTLTGVVMIRANGAIVVLTLDLLGANDGS